MLDGMLPRTLGRIGAPDPGDPFLPLSFRFFAAFGLLVLHLALPADVRAGGPGEGLYLAGLAALFLEAAWESARGLRGMEALFPTPTLPWIRWNLALDVLLVMLVIAFEGVTQERFATLTIVPVLASAFYLGTVEIVWVGVLSAACHIVLVLGFAFEVFPDFGRSSGLDRLEPANLPFLLGFASLQVLASTLLVVLIRRHLERLSTDLTASEATMGELSALHRRVVESMTSGLITLDPAGRATSANPAATGILGRPVPLGQPVTDLIPLPAGFLRGTGREQRFETAIAMPDGGRRILGGHLALLRGASGRESGHLLLFQDLTELKALEERTRMHERLAAVGQMTAGLAHELRNPLASISGCVQLLNRPGNAPEVQQRVLGILGRETQRVSAILTDFLDVAKPQPPVQGATRLPAFLEEVRASWETDLRTEGVRLELSPVPPVTVAVDTVSFHRVLTNLLSNARKAVAGAAQPRVRVDVAERAEGLVLSVQDNGCGMSQDQLDALFVPFAGSFPEGTGLGMSLVYKVTQTLGWRIEVDSRPGSGTTVILHIPSESVDRTLASEAVQT